MAYMTIEDLKAELRIGNTTAYQLVKIRSFPAINLSGRWLIDADRLHQWMANLQKLPDKGASVLGRRQSK